MDEVPTDPSNKDVPANPSYGRYDPAFSRDREETPGEQFSFSDFFLDKFPIATGIAALALSLFYSRMLSGFPAFVGFLIVAFLSLSAIPAVLASLIALPTAAVIMSRKNRPFGKAFKPPFTLLLFVFWILLVVFYFIGASELRALYGVNPR